MLHRFKRTYNRRKQDNERYGQTEIRTETSIASLVQMTRCCETMKGVDVLRLLYCLDYETTGRQVQRCLQVSVGFRAGKDGSAPSVKVDGDLLLQRRGH